LKAPHLQQIILLLLLLLFRRHGVAAVAAFAAFHHYILDLHLLVHQTNKQLWQNQVLLVFLLLEQEGKQGNVNLKVVVVETDGRIGVHRFRIF
jgi:hypothetical protein